MIRLMQEHCHLDTEQQVTLKCLTEIHWAFGHVFASVLGEKEGWLSSVALRREEF